MLCALVVLVFSTSEAIVTDGSQRENKGNGSQRAIAFHKNRTDANWSNNATLYLGYANTAFGPSKNQINKIVGSDGGKSVVNNLGNMEIRSKRGVLHLYNMVGCATGCNPLIYKGYGCFCGFLGSGYPVDGIDRYSGLIMAARKEHDISCIKRVCFAHDVMRCCKRHDWCYNHSNCPLFLEYFVPYYWMCRKGKPVCAVKHAEWGGKNSCSHKLCECDRVLSECLKQFPCPSKRAICTSSPWRLIQNNIMLFSLI